MSVAVRVFALVVAAITFALAPLAHADTVFTDPQGDAQPGAPDITSVVVSDDPASATIRFRVNVEAERLIIWIDADRDKSSGIQVTPTGAPSFLRGADHVLDYGINSPRTATLSTWNGTTFAPRPSSARAEVGGGSTELSIGRSDIENTLSLDFKVRAFGTGSFGEDVIDDAPERPDWWTYTLTLLKLTIEKRGPGRGTVSDATGAITCGDTCSADFEQGTTITLSATPDADSTFAGWSGGGCDGIDPTCVLTLTEDTVVTAAFDKKVPPGTPSGSATGTVLVGGAPYRSGPIPYGSRVDVTKGSLRLTTRAGTLTLSGRGVTAVFLLLKRSERGRQLDLLKLVGGDFSVCKQSRRTISSADAKKKTKKTVRRLWAKGKGRFRTQGKYSYTTVRGTYWLTADRCDGTLTQVKQGRVEVYDLVRRTRAQLRAGQSYVAGS